MGNLVVNSLSLVHNKNQLVFYHDYLIAVIQYNLFQVFLNKMNNSISEVFIGLSNWSFPWQDSFFISLFSCRPLEVQKVTVRRKGGKRLVKQEINSWHVMWQSPLLNMRQSLHRDNFSSYPQPLCLWPSCSWANWT